MRTYNPFRLLLQVTTLLLCAVNLAFAAEPPTEPMLRFDLGEHHRIKPTLRDCLR